MQITVVLDEKSMYTLSMSVPEVKVTVMTRPAGWVSPEPAMSPTPTSLLFVLIVAVRPFSAATLSITPLAKATSTVCQERAVSASMSTPDVPIVAVSLEYAKICIVCPILRPKIVPYVSVLASERRARGVAKSAAPAAFCSPPPPPPNRPSACSASESARGAPAARPKSRQARPRQGVPLRPPRPPRPPRRERHTPCSEARRCTPRALRRGAPPVRSFERAPERTGTRRARAGCAAPCAACGSLRSAGA
mmetsp:Transcript_8328/g.24540  ORF Transcript_8328/g.24540 Transcript_8328/m.24540 type:complete len:249 (+) Transcript_8328:2-748(+)